MLSSPVNAAGVNFVRDHLAVFPRPDREAVSAIRNWAKARNIVVDPDQVQVVTLHYVPQGPHGYLAKVVSSLSMTQALLSNWQGESANNLVGALFGSPWAGTFPDGPVSWVDNLPTPGFNHYGADYQVFNGLFTPSPSGHYDSSHCLPLPAEDFQRFIHDQDFHGQFRAMLDDYWRQHQDNHRLSNQIAFVAACNKQAQEGSLSHAAGQLAWEAAGLVTTSAKLHVSVLNIYGYAATDLLCIRDTASDLTLLYIPGNSSPLIEFATQHQMQDWFAEQCRDGAKRQVLRQFFMLAETPDGLDFSGLDTALAGLGEYPAIHHLPPQRPGFTTDGRWSPRDYVNYRPEHYSPTFTGDTFKALAERQRQRSYADADFIITSNQQIREQHWHAYLTCALNLLTPFAFVVPGLAPLIALGGIAQFGFGLDQAINGRTQQEKADGVHDIAYGLFNALPLAVSGVRKAATVFRLKSDAFVMPSRVNDQLGYPLSPVRPPHLPALEVAPYFHEPDAIPPLADGDPAVAASVVRTPRYNGDPDDLSCLINNYNRRVIYDMERDVFVAEDEINEVSPTGYVASPGSRDLQPVSPAREVSDSTRTATLRGLGVDLPLPVELPQLPVDGSLPIPKKIFSVWVGDKVVPDNLVSNLQNNAAWLQQSEYKFRLLLSNASPAAFAVNMRRLADHAPMLEVQILEEQPFFETFRQSKYYAQYQAALDGNGGVATNFASASDVLRYPLLNHEGGLYLDADDSLLEPGKSIYQPDKLIDQINLSTTPDGLLLPPPMSNEKMGMNCLYNTSVIGSHAGNPTLQAISEEMFNRYQATPDFYDSKPSQSTDPAGFYRYANRLSSMTGPAMFTDVVERHLPRLRTLRQVTNLYAMPRLNSWQFVPTEHFKQLLKELLPLDRVVRIGGNHSWAQT
jgi:hypothetical protein